MKTLIALLASAALLAGCAGVSTVTSEVSSFGEWPAGKAAGTYAFERLPSQQASPERSASLEKAATAALSRAGFKPAASGQEPDVLVQVAARESRSDTVLWADSLWWRGSFGSWRYRPWVGPGWGIGYGGAYPSPRYEQEVALLIRDRASGKPLFEARASHEGGWRGDAAMLSTMFQSALMDFPKTGINPRSVTLPLVAAP